ncbi:helix-turn-helix domain-containing protein [Pseudofulvibacter geojedonensis]|uniref:Helix-turn-helix domain-containing protein n=1 Tax=Pseudofulvibacter geojedonensis TaxID=1123758 RepID=A0ABW3I4Z7_9FLAO
MCSPCFICKLCKESYPEISNFTIEVISKMSGFHSKSAFNKAFKNIVGMTPSVYKKEKTLYK